MLSGIFNRNIFIGIFCRGIAIGSDILSYRISSIEGGGGDKNHCELRFLSIPNSGIVVDAQLRTQMRLNENIPILYLAMLPPFCMIVISHDIHCNL